MRFTFVVWMIGAGWLAAPLTAEAQDGFTVAAEPVFTVGATAAGSNSTFFESLVDAVPARGESSFWLLDRAAKRIYRVSGSGEVRSAFGRDGMGPGEFRDPVGFVGAESDSLAVFDRSLQRVSIFNEEGQFERSITLSTGLRPFGVLHRLGARWLGLGVDRAATPSDHGLGRDTVPISWVDPDGGSSTVARMPASLSSHTRFQGRQAVRMSPFSPTAFLLSRNGCGVFGATDGVTVTVLGADGTTAEIPLDLPQRKATDEDWRVTRTHLLEAVPEAARTAAGVALDGLPRPDFVPRFSAALLDADGFLWLQEWQPPTGSGPAWSIHDRTGTPVGRITFDRPVQLLFVARELALGTYLDDFGAEVLAGWKVERPGRFVGFEC